MVSVATKISMFTMFSTMALGRQLAGLDDFGSQLNDQLAALEAAIAQLETSHNTQM